MFQEEYAAPFAGGGPQPILLGKMESGLLQSCTNQLQLRAHDNIFARKAKL